MRHHTAVPLADGSGYHYASVHPRRGGYPLGYCAEHPPHPTEEEARECYAQYRRDHVALDNALGDWSGCEVDDCDVPTKTAATIRGDGFALAALCAEHLTHEHAVAVLKLDGPAGDAWVS
jgi:hypothetical protein